jgi:hypothetical protein
VTLGLDRGASGSQRRGLPGTRRALDDDQLRLAGQPCYDLMLSRI